MPHRLRKIRKQRGSRTHGWGQVGQHRKHGMKGGRGKTGTLKHKRSFMMNLPHNQSEKKGFICPTGIGILKTINVGYLDQLVDNLVAEGKVKIEDGKYPLDLPAFGYDKILGGGQVTKPLVIKSKSCSKNAIKKIEEAGGKLVKLEK
ncbi:MAG: uL15 family ribosomal protein [Candidatus Bathyarchaeota archaeon]